MKKNKLTNPFLIGVAVISAILVSTINLKVEVLEVKATTLANNQETVKRNW